MKKKYGVKYLIGHFWHPYDKSKKPREDYETKTATILAEDERDVRRQLTNRHDDTQNEKYWVRSTSFMKILSIYTLS